MYYVEKASWRTCKLYGPPCNRSRTDYSQLTTYFDEHNQVAWGYMNAATSPLFYRDPAAGDRLVW